MRHDVSRGEYIDDSISIDIMMYFCILELIMRRFYPVPFALLYLLWMSALFSVSSYRRLLSVAVGPCFGRRILF